MQCEDLAQQLAEVVDGTVALDQSANAHVERCLRCQAELAQYRKLLRALHQLRAEVIDPGPRLLVNIFEAIEAAGERHALRAAFTGRRAAYLGGLAAATAATAAGAFFLAARARRLRPAV